jgi:hypothetical protein
LYQGTTHYTFWQYQQTKRATPTIALASGASWAVNTPTVYAGISKSSIASSAGVFYGTATAGNPVLTAAIEL